MQKGSGSLGALTSPHLCPLQGTRQERKGEKGEILGPAEQDALDGARHAGNPVRFKRGAEDVDTEQTPPAPPTPPRGPMSSPHTPASGASSGTASTCCASQDNCPRTWQSTHPQGPQDRPGTGRGVLRPDQDNVHTPVGELQTGHVVDLPRLLPGLSWGFPNGWSGKVPGNVPPRPLHGYPLLGDRFWELPPEADTGLGLAQTVLGT